MILKGSKRSGGGALADHLMNEKDNDHIEVHDLRGFSSEDLEGAFQEIEAAASGTRCKQYLFSLSLSPPELENVPIQIFENAIERIEKKLGLDGQPRAIVFHEKEGRRHAHCVWSRIDGEKMKAIEQPFFKNRLMEISKQLYLEQGWDLPRGHINSKFRDPLNFTLAEWQQAKRNGHDPKELKALFQHCWTVSDNKQSFARALEDRGFYLAQGKSRGFVALDYFGKVYSLSRGTGVSPKDIAAKIGPPDTLPKEADLREKIAASMSNTLQKYEENVRTEVKRDLEPILRERLEMREKHREERKQQEAFHQKRTNQETAARAAKLPRGLLGIWHRLTGKYQAVRADNEKQMKESQKRDRDQKELLIQQQRKERQALQQEYKEIKGEHASTLQKLREHTAYYMKLGMGRNAPSTHKNIEISKANQNSNERTRER